MVYNFGMHTFTFLFFDGCPSWRPALENLEQVLDEENIPGEISLVKVDTPEQAESQRFLGSPSIRMDETDLWPEQRESYSLSCRVYAAPDGLKGAPTREMIRARLREVLAST